ncbi:MAG: glucose-6-phosphate isomerase [Desulfobacterales bacterium CG23_combo_of_CG06-09_8_20_14_all_51_8]|nr:MAG: glucose-6-phosphate isomerase [Desulfobacterales bacterium CG23_combo_of_CG06-09_8_20_14_all_51_8]
MTDHDLQSLPEWTKLAGEAGRMKLAENHLKNLIRQGNRLKAFSLAGAGLFYDFSRQRLDRESVNALVRLAKAREIKARFERMMSGDHVNTTENRAALHTATRSFSDDPVMDGNADIMPAIRAIRDEIRKFSGEFHDGKIAGHDRKPFTDIVVIGIGGSYLGTEFVATALSHLADKGVRLHFLSNVDIDNFGAIAARVPAETTLWVVISKSYTTAETTANTVLALEFLKENGLDPKHHVVTVTSQGSPGDDPKNPVLKTFYMFDYIGGRYSVTSAVGGVPLSLYLGYDRFAEFLKGAEEMDIHARTAPEETNIPLMAALISVWNNNFLGYPALGLIPYASALAKLSAHVQQLSMESNGKSVTCDGKPVKIDCGTIIFGEPGTNAQHSFFQLAHQGRPFPIEFIGVLNPACDEYSIKSKGVTNHQELFANLMAQSQALATGKDDTNPAKFFSGNRPSSTLLLQDLSPKNIGRLLAFYEAKTVFEAFIWGINPFDQFGVELGKVMAGDIRREMAEKNKNPDYLFDNRDPIRKFYLEALFGGMDRR